MQQLEDEFMGRDVEARQLRAEVERVQADAEAKVEAAMREATRQAQGHWAAQAEEMGAR